MERTLKRRISELAGDMETEITEAAREVAKVPCEGAAEWTRDAYTNAGGKLSAETFSDMFAAPAEDALRMVISGRAYLDGKSLSKRIWNQAGRLSGGISQILEDGIAQQKSTAEIARELEQYINPDARETIAERAARVKNAAKLPFAGNIEYNCQRLARTSINHAYFLALKESAALDPFCRAIHWELSDEHFTRQVLPFGVDICDEYATHDEGLGVGNWPIDGVPLPHAQCLCAQWAETPESLEECGARLRRWLDGGQDKELESAYGNWKDAMISGMPNRRLESIRDDAGETRKRLLEKIAGRQDVKALSVAERTRLDERLIDASEEELETIANSRDGLNRVREDGKMDMGSNASMDAETLNKIIEAFKRLGGVIQMDEDTDRYLELRHADGITYNSDTILLRRNPTRAAVFEELIHTAQYREGKNDGSHTAICRCEIEAQQKLLRNSKAYGLTDADVELTKKNLDLWQRQLDELIAKGGE